MTEKFKYKVGDRFLFEVVVSEIDVEDTEAPYYLSFGDDHDLWATEEELETLFDRLPPKPKVTQEVMDWYENNKSKNWNINGYLNNVPEEFYDWILYSDDVIKNQHAFATLVAYGPEAVEVETEKIYRVKIKNLVTSDGKEQFLTHDIPKRTVFASRYGKNLKQTFTNWELVLLGFEGVFDNPMFEVEEVE
ncbi:DUF1642 domain-containing protein [Streptococcus danieliae]|nr:DUF1642 domain-containing protein [Streptococcus danieliae]